MEELGERISAEEFALHQAYWRREPSGPEGRMLMWSALMAAIANGALIRKDKRSFTATDFWPDTWAPPPAPKPGRKKSTLAPDFSHLKGMKVAKARRSGNG